MEPLFKVYLFAISVILLLLSIFCKNEQKSVKACVMSRDLDVQLRGCKLYIQPLVGPPLLFTGTIHSAGGPLFAALQELGLNPTLRKLGVTAGTAYFGMTLDAVPGVLAAQLAEWSFHQKEHATVSILHVPNRYAELGRGSFTLKDITPVSFGDSDLPRPTDFLKLSASDIDIGFEGTLHPQPFIDLSKITAMS